LASAAFRAASCFFSAAFAGLQILQLRAQGFDGRHVRRLGGLQIGDLILQRCDLRG
jgi:hypothetical protein